MDVIDEKRIQNVDRDEIEIRLSDVIKFIKDNRLKILLGGIIGLIIGILYVFPKPNMYTVEITVMPEFRGKGPGGLSSITSDLLGLGSDNSNSSEPTIRPDLYPNVLESVPFALNMLKQQVYSKNFGAKMTLQEFISRTGENSFVGRIIGFLTASGDNDNANGIKPDPGNTSRAIQVTKEEDGLIKAVLGSVLSVYDKKTGILTIKAVEPDPVVAATVASLSLKYLTDYIVEYRTEKARKRVYFLTQQMLDAKKRYQAAEYALSNYRDRNRSLYLNTAKIDEQRLQSDYLLEQSVYNDLAKQLEQAKIKIEEDTPTFKTLEPALIPLHKSGPKRTSTIIGFAVIGGIISLIIAFIRRIVMLNKAA